MGGYGEIDLRIARATPVLPVLALLHIHIHLHHQFHGPPFDYAGLAVAAVASWAGLPGPGEPVLIAAGVLAAKHQLDITSVVFVAWVAATAGGLIGWLVGLKAGRAFVTAPGPLRAARVRAADRGEQVFKRYPVIAILLTPAWVAGINRVRGKVYHPTNVISALLWAAGLGFGSYWIGPAVLDAFDDLGLVSIIIVVAVCAVGLAVEIRRRRRRASRA
jgi:membrane protein DedA with SNARE-associated domain